MNTQPKSTTNFPASSAHFTGQSLCAEGFPIPFASIPDAEMGMAEAIPGEGQTRFKLWLNRIGIAGFSFFLVKGLVWLAIFTFGADAIKHLFY